MEGWLAMKYEYMKSTLFPNCPYLVRYGGGVIYEDWVCNRQSWEPERDVMGVFFGFESGFKRITEEEANQIIADWVKEHPKTV